MYSYFYISLRVIFVINAKYFVRLHIYSAQHCLEWLHSYEVCYCNSPIKLEKADSKYFIFKHKQHNISFLFYEVDIMTIIHRFTDQFFPCKKGVI